MRPANLLLLWCALTPARADSGWAYVPASRDAHASQVFAAQLPQEEEDPVRLVGAGAPRAPAGAEPRPVVAVELAGAVEDRDCGLRAAEPAADAIPEGARWPDADGAIETGEPAPGNAQEKPAIRNPWEVRVRAKTVASAAAFLYGGIIDGGEGGPVAFVNGRLVRVGDALGLFRVVRVAGSAVVLERGGAYFVLPRGRRTRIISADW